MRYLLIGSERVEWHRLNYNEITTVSPPRLSISPSRFALTCVLLIHLLAARSTRLAAGTSLRELAFAISSERVRQIAVADGGPHKRRRRAP